MRKYPDLIKIKNALIKIKMKSKIKLIEKAGRIIKIKNIFVQIAGVNTKTAREFIEISCTKSNIPEPLRISHLVASGIVNGESMGRA